MKILTVYKSIILSDSDIAGKIGDSIFIEKVDQNTERPNILLQSPEQGTDYTHDGPNNVFDAEVRITVRSDTAQEASEIGDLIIDLLAPWTGTEFGLQVMMTKLFNIKSHFDSSAKVFEQTLEFTSFYRKA